MDAENCLSGTGKEGLNRMQRVRRVLKNTVRGYITKDVGKRAASLTYYLLFAIFPFLVALISILGLLHLPMISLEGEAAAFLPADVITLLNRTITHMTEASNGAIFTFGVVFALWFPFRAVRNMTEEVSDIYGGEKPTHHTLRVLLLAIFILFLIPAMLFLMIIGDSVSADYGGIYLLLDKGAFPFHGLCADSVDLGSVLSFAESAAEVAVYFSRGAAFYILLDAVFRIFLVLCRPHGELFRDLRLYRGNHRLPYLAESFADGTASGGSV